MSCIRPIAPLRETACGLKFDSTLMSARTRLGSTLWREAAWSMAASMLADFARRSEFLPGVSACSEANPLFSTKSETSAAADLAARKAADFGRGTVFQRPCKLLQYTNSPLAGAFLGSPTGTGLNLGWDSSLT